MEMEDFTRIYELGYQHGYKMGVLDTQINNLQVETEKLNDKAHRIDYDR